MVLFMHKYQRRSVEQAMLIQAETAKVQSFRFVSSVIHTRVFQKSWAHFDHEYLGNYSGYKSTYSKFGKLVISIFTRNV